MQKAILAAILVAGLAGFSTKAQGLKPVEEKSSVAFAVKNFGINTRGDFRGLEGRISFDPGNAAAATFEMSVLASTVNTDMDTRDSHLRGPEYFDAEHYPKILFVATRVSSAGRGGRFRMEGKLTIKGNTREIAFPFTAKPAGNGYLFEANFRINRRDFQIGQRSMVLGDEVTVDLSVLTGKE